MNKNQKKTIVDLIRMVLYELLLDHFPHRTNIGGIMNIYLFEGKPDPLVTELKSIRCDKTGIILCLEVTRGKFNDLNLCYG